MIDSPRENSSIRLPGWYDLSVRVLVILGAGVVWEVVSRSGLVNPLLFPPPTRVAVSMIEWASSGELARDVSSSLWRAFVGLFVGGILGLAIGLSTGRSRVLERVIGTLIQLLRPMPPVAIIPLVIVWLGIDNQAKIFSISFAVFFPVWISTHLGAASVAPIYIWSARSLVQSKVAIVFKILLPATLPYAIAGLRTGIAVAFVMVYVSEIAGSSSGLGYQISISHLAYRIDRMMAALVALGALGAVTDFTFMKVTLYSFPWINREK